MPTYVTTLKSIVENWPWASADLKTAVQAQIDGCSTTDPETFLDELLAAHIADDANHVPEFTAHLRRLRYQYIAEGPGIDPDALLETILRLYSVVG